MKLLLDECVPERLKNDFTNHDILTVHDVGLRGMKNGELLRSAATEFEVVVTVDRQMSKQQDISKLNLALIVLVAKPCRYAQLKLLIPRILEALQTIKHGDVIEISSV